MTQAESTLSAVELRAERPKLKRELTLLPLAGIIYFTVCGGSFGAEPLIGWSGPGLAMVLFIVTPLIFSIPNMLMVRELNSMMPAEGGYYHWIKQAFGPFAGFMAGWMNWVVAWVDVSIYPVLAAYYLGYFIPQLRDGAVVFGLEFPSWLLSWFVAIMLIWGISYLNVRGARTAALTTNWLGVVMLIPLILFTIFGFIAWAKAGTTPSLPFLPGGQPITPDALFSALSTGLFVVMWNYMGWELPTAAGDEIVNPRKTYPAAMALVLVATILTYVLPTTAGLYGGAGAEGRYLLWGIEENAEGAGIGAAVADYGLSEDQLTAWGVDPASDIGWEFPDIAHAIGDNLAGRDSSLSYLLGSLTTLAAVLSMIGLFIGNGLGGTRVPFALAEDGMMPRWMTKIHPRHGTPWVAIVFCGVIFSIFSLQAFAFLVVVDVFLNMVVLMGCFLALWKLRFSMPHVPRQKVPGGYLGLTLVTLGPALIIGLAIYSQLVEEGMSSLWLAVGAILLGVLLYPPLRKWIKPGVPDVDPFAAAD
jgi:amino acid transporter